MIERQVVFGLFVGLAIISLGLFSSMQAAGGVGLILVGLFSLSVTLFCWRFSAEKNIERHAENLVRIPVSDRS